jgi:putative transposase
LLVSAV